MTPIVNQTPKCREHFMCVVLLDVFATLDTGMSVKWWAHEGSQGRRNVGRVWGSPQFQILHTVHSA